jgi:hypothetical protein
MGNRDEFSAKTKAVVALRANQHCSFRSCGQPTSGPSEESPEAVNMTGKAAHIHAAAPGPGARRYLASMTPRRALGYLECHLAVRKSRRPDRQG